MSELTAMLNIGRVMARILTAVGIDSPGKLRQVGSKQAYFRIKEVFPNVCLVHLYALEGAVTDRDYNRLPEERKKDLKQFSDVLRGRTQHGTEHEEG